MERTLKIVFVILAIVISLLLVSLIGFGVYNSINMGAEKSSSNIVKSDLTEYEQAILGDRRRASKTPDKSNHQSTSSKVTKDLRKEREIYRKLKAVCDSWTDSYKQTRNELSRLNMNDACRQAKDYAKRELNVDSYASYAKFQVNKNNSMNKRPVVASYESSNNSQCARWEKNLENIQSQLRAGYEEPRGNYLREKRREISGLIRDNCRV